MAPSASAADPTSRPSPLRVEREAFVIFGVATFDSSPYTAAVTSTIALSTGSRTTMTTRRTARVMTLPTRGRPAVTATSCSRPMSPTSRCEVSPIDAFEW